MSSAAIVALAIPSMFAVWGLLGSAQLIVLNAFHLEQRVSVSAVIRDLRQKESSSRSAQLMRHRSGPNLTGLTRCRACRPANRVRVWLESFRAEIRFV